MRDPVDVQCPAVTAGQLVITELRGDQSGEDTYGQWIELYNGSGAELDLQGAHLAMSKLDGSGTARIVIRSSLPVAPGGYTVLGKFAAGALPAHVDYGYLLDFDASLYDSAAIDVEACGQRIDRVIYHDLTGVGSWAFDGNLDPSATSNDDEANWCDDVSNPMPDPTMLGLPGSPGERNPTCGP